jgi:3-aminobutyryl-CoA ammonia-lyase
MSVKASLRIRVSEKDVHYSGGLVDGARILALFGDLATELLIRHDGDEGLFVAYDSVQFMAPVHSGDFIEAEGQITKFGNTSRRMEFVARKVISVTGKPHPSSASVLTEPITVCQATGTCVVPVGRQVS